jgi:transposase-like protein
MAKQLVSKERVRRTFTPQQKFEIVQAIGSSPTIREGIERFNITYGLYFKWKRQLEVGINASLRNSKALKSQDCRELEKENRLLKEMVLNLSFQVCELKKTLSLSL